MLGPNLAQTAVGGERPALAAFSPAGKTLGECPLKHTAVRVRISGPLARVTVVQEYVNPFKEKIESVYTFPLSHRGAVDRMRIDVGDRTIRGVVKEKHEARATYERAKRQGRLAALLDQQRPNVFQQAFANIEPGQSVKIGISYTETLQWRDGEYRFELPTVVGPRYVPGSPIGRSSSTGRGTPTDQVPDADRITPPVAPADARAGHDLSLTVYLDAGLPVGRIESDQHEIDVDYVMASAMKACLAERASRRRRA